jgi:tRNA (guanine37-N1)-methyltransferase|tara:strand:+ start:649 stop:1392 length:744 start_codon:yes stop_codon:yes gene_type:complete
MKFTLITLFPDEISSSISFGILGRAIKNKVIEVDYISLRDYSDNKYQSIDDKPYGGGPGMLIQAEPLIKAINKVRSESNKNIPVIFLTPQGKLFTQKTAKAYSQINQLIIVSGRYEGFDERVHELVDNSSEISIGDYVISGGEIATAVIIDAITRLLPGALGDENSAKQDSFSEGLLDYPHYTRPEEVEGIKVPEVLLSGNHNAINQWRFKQSIGKTFDKRPDLIKKRNLTDEEEEILNEYIKDNKE